MEKKQAKIKHVWIYQGRLGDGPLVFSNPKKAYEFIIMRVEFTGRGKIKYHPLTDTYASIPTYSGFKRAILQEGVCAYVDIYGETHSVIKRTLNPI